MPGNPPTDTAPPHPEPTPAAAARHALSLAAELGFAKAGIAPARPSRWADTFHAWIDAGRHGDMHYLADTADVRADPTALLPPDGPPARSVICVLDAYASRDAYAPNASNRPASTTARFARYGLGDDYHKAMKRRLHTLADALRERHPGHAFRSTCDTAPLAEREVAAAAGLGWIGKHTLLLSRDAGSWTLLGCVVTSLDLAPTAPPDADLEQQALDGCGACTRCIDACPTDAITTDPAPGAASRSLDATRCVSYLTLEHRDAIDPALHPGMRDWVGGCDVCQEVCPFHGGPLATPTHPTYNPRDELLGLPLLDLLRWTEDDRRRVLKGSAFKRMKLWMLHRNALIAAGNALREQPDPTLLDAIREYLHHEHPVVRATAQQILRAHTGVRA